MKTIQLIVIVILCSIYGTYCTTIRLGHRPDNSYSSIGNFGPFEPYVKPLKSSLQKATVSICHTSKLCHHEMLNQPPFVNLLGEYHYHDSHRSPFSFLHDLSPRELMGQALRDILGGVNKAETDVALAPFRAMINSVQGIFG